MRTGARHHDVEGMEPRSPECLPELSDIIKLQVGAQVMLIKVRENSLYVAPRSYTRTERRARSARQWLSGKSY